MFDVSRVEREIGNRTLSLETGKIAAYASSATPDGVAFDYSLPPSGSLLVFLSNESQTHVADKDVTFEEIPSTGPPTIRRLEPNVLTLDYVDVKVGDEAMKGAHFTRAAPVVFQKNGMNGNPWDRGVQFRDELITKTFPPGSGFEATYRFVIREQVPDPLQIVIERPDLYTVTCNGEPVAAKPGDWWLDKSFGKVDISAAAKVGENAVTIKASPFSIYHELESAYLLGEFSLEPGDSGFAVVAARPLRLSQAGWREQGLPFYSTGVAYTETFEVPKPSGRYVVSLSKWFGSVAKVVTNGQVAGYIGYPPWECDVSQWIKPGENQIEVVVIGTLRNSLGPHHIGPVSGKAWPHMFHQAPKTGPPAGKDYSTLSYGLFEPFVLKHSAE